MNKTQPKPKTRCLPDDASIKQLLQGMGDAVYNIRWALILADREHCLRNLYDRPHDASPLRIVLQL